MFSKTDRPPWFLTRKAPVFSFSVLRQQLLSISTARQAASNYKTRRGWVVATHPNIPISMILIDLYLN